MVAQYLAALVRNVLRLSADQTRRAEPFHVHRVGEKLRLPSDHELSKCIFANHPLTQWVSFG